MSPEQASGLESDPRADVWGFGCCLYEALTGQRPFSGEDAAQTLASVLKDEPDWDALPSDLPANIAVLVRRCLEKSRRRAAAEHRRRAARADRVAPTAGQARSAAGGSDAAPSTGTALDRSSGRAGGASRELLRRRRTPRPKRHFERSHRADASLDRGARRPRHPAARRREQPADLERRPRPLSDRRPRLGSPDLRPPARRRGPSARCREPRVSRTPPSWSRPTASGWGSTGIARCGK